MVLNQHGKSRGEFDYSKVELPEMRPHHNMCQPVLYCDHRAILKDLAPHLKVIDWLNYFDIKFFVQGTCGRTFVGSKLAAETLSEIIPKQQRRMVYIKQINGDFDLRFYEANHYVPPHNLQSLEDEEIEEEIPEDDDETVVEAEEYRAEFTREDFKLLPSEKLNKKFDKSLPLDQQFCYQMPLRHEELRSWLKQWNTSHRNGTTFILKLDPNTTVQGICNILDVINQDCWNEAILMYE